MQTLRVVQWQLIQLCLSGCECVVALVRKLSKMVQCWSKFCIQQSVSHVIFHHILKAMAVPV